MAKAEKTERVVEEVFTLTLTRAEAEDLYGILYRAVAGSLNGPRGTSNDIHEALYEAGVRKTRVTAERTAVVEAGTVRYTSR